jgi:hypothetical protein
MSMGSSMGSDPSMGSMGSSMGSDPSVHVHGVHGVGSMGSSMGSPHGVRSGKRFTKPSSMGSGTVLDMSMELLNLLTYQTTNR